MSWVDCVVDSDYEIFSEFPFQIRKKSNQRIIAEWRHKTQDYIQCKMNGRRYSKHRVVALQFIPNDDPINKNEVDHISHDRTDYHIQNLRWVSRNENQKNTAGHNGFRYEFVEKLPDDAIKIETYKGIEFDDYFYSPETGKCYYDNGLNIRIIPYQRASTNSPYINVRDINNIQRAIYIKIWLRLECIE